MVRYEVLKEVWEGRPVERAVIESGAYSASVLSLGAVLESLIVPDRDGRPRNVVLHMDNVLDNVESPHYGQIIGRFANRIAGASFTLNGKEYFLERNEKGNCLHSGRSDWGTHQWTMERPSATDFRVTLRYHSADGDGGMPGAMDATVSYALSVEGRLSITYTATSDGDTPCNLTNHTYFNLSSGDIGKCLLTLSASHILEVDDALIPTGKILSVAGGPFDFRQEKRIGRDIGETGVGYDHCYILDRKGDGLEEFGRVRDGSSGIEMTMYTTMPAVQFYSGNFLDGSAKAAGAKRHEGMCFETQFYPDSPNHPDFPSCILKAGETFTSETVYAFSVR